jgi:nicotinate-nucleotide adenylyltransferase
VEQTQLVGLFGGSFNPPHVGHVLAVAYALSVWRLDRIIVVPVYAHPFGKALAPFSDRLALCAAAFEDLKNIEISDIEAHLAVPSRTLRTLEALRSRHTGYQFRLIVGSDILGELDQWHAIDVIRRLAPPLILPRTGEGARTPVLPQVSSTHVRSLLSRLQATSGVNKPEGDPVTSELAEYLPARVLDYVVRHGLYR